MVDLSNARQATVMEVLNAAALLYGQNRKNPYLATVFSELKGVEQQALEWEQRELQRAEMKSASPPMAEEPAAEEPKPKAKSKTKAKDDTEGTAG